MGVAAHGPFDAVERVLNLLVLFCRSLSEYQELLE